MGGAPTKPELNTYLADQTVKAGDKATLQCEVNTEDVTVTWEKNGSNLQCVQGKHTATKSGTTLKLVIHDVQEGDEGNYRVTAKNDSGSCSCSAMLTVELKKWREIPQTQNEMLTALRNFPVHKNIPELRFLLHGPVGSGKSSIINTLKSIFENRPYHLSLASAGTSTSFTLTYQKFTIGSERSGILPFVFYDVMGLEEGKTEGMHIDDIISALEGHIPDGYKFQPYPMTKENRTYISNPDLKDKIHCLVSVLPADSIQRMSDKVIDKMKAVRKAASELGIPQMVFMTRVDEACPIVNNDISKVYQSKKIKVKVQECKNRLGVPENCIFPVKNYHNETELNPEINRLMLAALTQIVFSANDYVEKCYANLKHSE